MLNKAIKLITRIKNIKNTDTLIFKDTLKKVAYLDSYGDETLAKQLTPEIGDTTLCYVVKSLEHNDFVRVNIGKKSISAFIRDIPNMSYDDIWNDDKVIWFLNTIYNAELRDVPSRYPDDLRILIKLYVDNKHKKIPTPEPTLLGFKEYLLILEYIYTTYILISIDTDNKKHNEWIGVNNGDTFNANGYTHANQKMVAKDSGTRPTNIQKINPFDELTRRLEQGVLYPCVYDGHKRYIELVTVSDELVLILSPTTIGELVDSKSVKLGHTVLTRNSDNCTFDNIKIHQANI